MDYQLWHGDCLEEMDRIEDGSIDCILADLPYNVTNCHWDTLIPFEPLWKQYKRVIKRNGAAVLFGSQPFTSLLVMSNLEWFKYEWIWKKSKASGHLNVKIMPLKAHESIVVFSSGPACYYPIKLPATQKSLDRNKRVNINPINARAGSIYNNSAAWVSRRTADDGTRYPLSVLEFNKVNNTVHPSQKPVALLSYLIKTYTNEGDTILDSTCGSGSTLEAAMRCNRHSIGIEKDAHYFSVATQRLARVAAELRGDLDHLPMFQEAVAV